MEGRLIHRLYLIIMMLLLFSVLSYIISILSFLSSDAKGVAYIVIILVAGVLIVNQFSDIIESKSGRRNRNLGNTMVFVTRLVGYVVVLAIALSSVRIGVTSILLGGGFAGVVIGLAAQASLSNFFSGIVLIFSRPFNMGDNITISTWQYGLIAPSYPPKFFSDDFLVPGYTGTVEKMTLTFTTIRLENNIPIKIPNGIVLQASIFLNNEIKRYVKVRYEVPSAIDPEKFISASKKELKKLNFLKEEPDIFISETSFANKTNIFSVNALCQSNSIELSRSGIIMKLIRVSDYLQNREK